MGLNKTFKFADLETKKNVFQQNPIHKGNWNKNFFKNNHPIVLELACGKAEYSIGMAKIFPTKNFIGVDIKGNRIWSAQRVATLENIENIAFIRDQIDHLDEYFMLGEVSEIWITFSDPFPRDGDHRKRLTSLHHLQVFKKILQPNAFINLKTDSDLLYNYTLETLQQIPSKIIKNYIDVYAMQKNEELFGIQTYYEKMHLKDNRTIKYLQFQLL